MLDTDYLLKLDKEGLLKPEFLVQIKLYLAIKNRDTQEKLNSLGIQQKKTYEYVNQIISIAKQQVEEDCQNILHRVKASEYIKNYKKAFVMNSTAKDGCSVFIKFVEEQVEEPRGSPMMRLKRTDPKPYPDTIDEFVKDLLMFPGIKGLISTGNDDTRIGAVYKEYMGILYEKLKADDAFFHDIDLEHREKIYQEIEAHVAFQLYSQAFPKSPSPADSAFYNKMLLLQWIDPVCLGVKKEDLQVDYWRTSAESTNMHYPA